MSEPEQSPAPASTSPAVAPAPASAATHTSDPPERANSALILPESLISSIDLAKITRELAALDDSLRQADIRAPGVPVKLSRSSQVLEDLAAANKMSLLDAAQRANLLNTLNSYANLAPSVHISFAVEPSPKFTHQMIIWLRQNIDPLILLEIGLQPMLAVGCNVRTNNKVFDMSLRHRFKEQRHKLKEKIALPEEAKPITAAAETPAVLPKEVPKG